VAHACNPSDWEAKTGGSWVKTSLGDIEFQDNLNRDAVSKLKAKWSHSCQSFQSKIKRLKRMGPYVWVF
jgi:hypothetical protein